METFQIILLAGIGLGVVQLSAGIAIGLWVGRRRNDRAAADRQRALRLAADLDGIAAQLSSSVAQHSERVTEAEQRLRKEESDAAAPSQPQGPLTELVVGVVGELVSANQRLLSDLDQTRSELSSCMSELAEHREQALTDPLTGLPNRRALDEQLASRMAEWRKHGTPFTVMMVDVDHFKRFNDTHGHQAGDAALRGVAAALRGQLRNHDLVARYGGEEFAIVLPYATLEHAAPAVGKVLEAVAAAALPTPNGETTVTASVGVACVQPQERIESLIERADAALYAAKENGRNQAWKHTGEALAAVHASGDPSAADTPSVDTPAAGDQQISDPGDPESEKRLAATCENLSASLADFLQEPTATADR